MCAYVYMCVCVHVRALSSTARNTPALTLIHFVRTLEPHAWTQIFGAELQLYRAEGVDLPAALLSADFAVPSCDACLGFISRHVACCPEAAAIGRCASTSMLCAVCVICHQLDLLSWPSFSLAFSLSLALSA